MRVEPTKLNRIIKTEGYYEDGDGRWVEGSPDIEELWRTTDNDLYREFKNACTHQASVDRSILWRLADRLITHVAQERKWATGMWNHGYPKHSEEYTKLSTHLIQYFRDNRESLIEQLSEETNDNANLAKAHICARDNENFEAWYLYDYPQYHRIIEDAFKDYRITQQELWRMTKEIRDFRIRFRNDIRYNGWSW